MKITQPTMLVNEKLVRANIANMFEKAQRSKVLFRPHFKTHQSADIGKWFLELGVEAITVSSVSMAEYFAENGWSNITIAFPVNITQIEQINILATKIQLGLLVESFETVAFLAEKLTSNVNIWIKIDTGYHRTGIDWNDEAKISKLIREIKQSEKMHFLGFLVHAGHSYAAKSTCEIIEVYEDTLLKLKNIQERMFLQGFAHVKLSIGDTPSCSMVNDFSGVDEIRPGNFVFYDAMQLKLGSCKEENIAAAVACPVVALHPERNEVIIYGGAIHLSKDHLINNDGTKNYGLVTLPEGKGWGKIIPGIYVSSISQEHGIIKANNDLVQKVKVGDIIFIIPIHSCLTANLLKKYYTLDEKELLFNSRC
ncbi:MAG: alanine racemase [Candidatus Heimdallarchaeota archaeon]|nr:alanine racemase [Candidatus Heimdallarchaeota archaeon]